MWSAKEGFLSLEWHGQYRDLELPALRNCQRAASVKEVTMRGLTASWQLAEGVFLPLTGLESGWKKYGSGLVRSVRWYYGVQVRENELLNLTVTAQMGPKDREQRS